MAKRKINDRMLKALKPAPAGKTYDVMDAFTPGLAVRVSETGRKTFTVIARFPGSRNPVRRAVGEYGALTLEAARSKARDWLEMVRQGRDPSELQKQAREAEQQRRDAATSNAFVTVLDKFCILKLKSQRRGKRVERIIRNELLAAWRNRPIGEISHRDVRAAIERIVERGAATYAHNVFDAACALFNFAVERDIIELNPCDRLKRRNIIGSKKHRERTLSDDELRALWLASDRLNYPFGPLYKLLVLTGVRLNEAAGARWREFDIEHATWTIPAERFKTGQQHRVPLTSDALAVLAALPRFNGGDHLFSTTLGKTAINSFSKGKQRLDALMQELHGGITTWVNHDIRRTVRSRLAALRVPDHIAEQVIGHGRKGIAQVYDQHRYDDEKREALAAWNARLRAIVDPPAANVVSLRKAAGSEA